MAAIVENVIYQHAENVCALWLQRQNVVEEPHYSFADLAHLDNLLEANLEGLRVAGQHAFSFFDEIIAAGYEGAIFTKALLAFEQRQIQVFSTLVEQAEKNEAHLSEIAVALAWIQPEHFRNLVRTLLQSDKPAAIIPGLKTWVAYGRNPEAFFDSCLRDNRVAVRAAAFRPCADTGLAGYADFIKHRVDAETDEEQFEQGRALAFLGQPTAAWKKLEPMVFSDSGYSAASGNLEVQLSEFKAARVLLRQSDSTPGRERDVVRGLGLIGDPAAVTWLIDSTEIPALCSLASRSINMIMEVDLAEQDLEILDAPEGFEYSGPNDDPADENVALEEDLDLPWSDTDRIRRWWESAPGLLTGRCFLDGREKLLNELQHVLVEGLQRQRNAAADCLTLLKPDQQYRDTHLPTYKQILWTG